MAAIDTLNRSEWTTSLLIEPEVAELFRVTPRTVQRWKVAGILNPIHVGGVTRYRATDVAALIDPPTSEAPAGNQGFAKTDVTASEHER